MPHDRAIAIRVATAIVLCALVVPAAAIERGLPAGVYAHGPRDRQAVALTFDLCPTRAPVELDERIVDALVAAGAPATFFVSGRWAQAKPDAVRRLAAEPRFELGNHGFRHAHLLVSGDATVRDEVEVTDRVLAELTGRTPHWFRAPYGEVDARVVRIAGDAGLGTVQYDVISGDPSPGITAATLVRTVLAQAKPGSIIVMHANHRVFHTAEAVPAIVDGLRARGFELVTVSHLLAVEPVP